MTVTDHPSRAVIYGRVQLSARPDSLQAQVAACRHFAESQNVEVVETYVDHSSANSPLHQRPGLMSLLAAVKNHEVDILVVEEFDRLSRMADMLAALLMEFRSAGIRVWSVTEESRTQAIIHFALAVGPEA